MITEFLGGVGLGGGGVGGCGERQLSGGLFNEWLVLKLYCCEQFSNQVV